MIKKINKRAANLNKSLIAASFIALASLSGMALSSNYYASTSRLASGHWVKVRITTEGIQQISYDQLRQWGFANPADVKVYGYGGTLLSDHIFSTSKPDDVQPTLSLHTADGRILFYGDADVRTTLAGTDSNNNFLYNVCRNYTANGGYYLLSDADAGGSISDAVQYSASAASTLTEHLSVNLYEKEAEMLSSTSCIFHSKTYSGGDNMDVTFSIRDYAPADNNYATYAVEAALLNEATWSTYTLGATSCDALTVTDTQSCSVETCYDGTLNYETGMGYSKVTPLSDETTIADGDYTFSKLVTAHNKLSYAALDRAVLIYPRKNILHSGDLILNFQSISANTNVQVQGATANTHIWNISNPANVYEHLGSYDADNATFTGTIDRSFSASDTSGACRLIAFNDNDAQNEVEYIGQVANQNIHGDATPNMVIITNDELQSYAEQLADLHRKYDGMDVAVYTQTQLFNEFGAGNPSAMAVRRALKMFYDRNKSKLKYVLMYGKSIADFRQIDTKPYYEPLITFEVEPISSDMRSAAANSHLNYGSDNYFGMLKDTDTPAKMTAATASVDVAIGRISAGNTGYASDVNAKLETYLNTKYPANNVMRALFVSDNGDSNQHFKQSLGSLSILKEGMPAITATQGHLLIYPHTDKSAKKLINLISDVLSSGVGFFCYSGHGGELGFGAEYMWSTSLVNSNDYKYAPVAMLSTCNSYCFDRTMSGIAENMLQKNDGGMIGVICSSRAVLLDANKLICDAFTDAYATAKGTVSLGELYRTAHNAAIKNSSRLSDRLNTLCYSLCGDPAIKITLPEQQVTITSVNNTNITATTSDDEVSITNFVPIYTQSMANVKAYVADSNGDIDTNFNGKATISIYDAPHTVSTIKVDSRDVITDVTLDETLLTSTSVNVVNGIINADIFVPYNTYAASETNTNRITVIAEDNDGKMASGVCSQAYVVDNASDNSAIEITEPQITELYIDKPEYSDGAVIGSTTPTLYANIKLGTAGLNNTGKIGDATSVSLDGVTLSDATNAIYTDSDGYAKLAYTFSTLDLGSHTVKLVVADCANNCVRQSINFTIEEIDGEISLTADRKTAYDEVSFAIQHTFYGEPDTRLIIEDSQHNTIFTADSPTFPYTWNLKDTDGKTVANGYYNAYIQAKYGTKTAASPKQPIVLLPN